MSLASLVLVPVLGFVLGGCEDTCLESDGQCTVSTPCEGLAFTCASPTATVNTLAVGDPVVGGVDALASPGDVVLSNGVVSAVIAFPTNDGGPAASTSTCFGTNAVGTRLRSFPCLTQSSRTAGSRSRRF